MSNISIINDLVNSIGTAKDRHAFRNYIEYIRFPYYKNLDLNTRINFTFPFTVFTGQNGSGKSSALHAIQGAPTGESPKKFWYSTAIDPINNQQSERHCFIYGYFNDDWTQMLEVLKTRVFLRGDPDYWEPSRPLKKYDMETMDGRRNPTITKHVIYHDFRAELSAYDKYFYFGNFNRTQNIQSKQDYIRKYAGHLKNVIDNDTIGYFFGSARNEKPITLSADALATVNTILGKNYNECKIIKHSWFQNEGYTVYYKTDAYNYSEAFAGRGEYAIVKIVYEILNAPNYTLVVLDEPEVSLHPGAQEQLKIFLLRQTLRKKLQIVISSHSPVFIEHLPDSAIKLFYPTATGKFIVKDTSHPVEAFSFIGIDNNEKSKIYVEDNLAKILLDSIISRMDQRYGLRFDVVFYPGGASEILKKAAIYSEENETEKFLLLDGDQRRGKTNPQTLPVADANNLDRLKEIVQNETGIEYKNLHFRIDSLGEGANQQQQINACNNYLQFLWTNLDYFPGNNNPEEIIWDENIANDLLATRNIPIPAFTNNVKSNFVAFATSYFKDSSSVSILASHRIFIDEFCNRNNDDYQTIVTIIQNFFNSLP